MSRFIRLLVLSCLLAACGDSVTSEEHLADGKALLEGEQFRAAVVEFKMALNKDVHQVEARALLGKAYYKLGDYDGADKELSRALEAGAAVDRSLVVPILAQTLLHIGDFDRLDDLEVDGLDDEARSTTLAAKGLAILYQGDVVVAEDLLQTAVATGEISLYARVAAARLSMAREDFDLARKQLQEIIAENRNYAPAWNLVGDIDAAQRKTKKAEQAYSQVLKLNNNAFDARLNRAMMRIYQQDFKGAREDLKALNRIHGRAAKTHPGVSFAEGIALMQSGNHTPARKAFEKTVDFTYAYPLAYYYMAVIDLQEGTLERALTEVYRFLALAPESIVGPKLAARLELELGGYHSAETLLQPVLEVYPNDIEALNLMASAILAQGRGGEGVELLLKIVELQPESAGAKARLGAGYIAAGEVDSAVAALEDAIVTNPKFEQADILLVVNFLSNDQPEEALEAALRYRDRNPGSSASYNLLGRAHLANGNLDEARDAFNKSLEINPADPASRHGLAEIALQRGQYSAARKQYRHVLKYHPERLSTQLDFAAAYALEGRETEMLERLALAIDTHPEATEPRLVLARYYIAKGQLEEAEPVLDSLSRLQRDQPDVLATLASFQLAGSRYHQALRTLERLVQLRPGISQYHYLRAKAYAGLGDTEHLLPELERAVELDPDHFYARIAMARLALLRGRGDLFAKRMAELKEVAPENPDVIQLEATAARMKGDNRYAGYLLGILFQQSPTTANAIGLANHWHQIGKTGQAIRQLEKWLKEHDQDIKAREALAELYRESRQRDKVVAEYMKIVQIDSDNVVALNNLAWHLLGQDPAQALAYAERAQALSPDSVAVLDTLAMAQLENGLTMAAQRTLERALGIDPDNPDLRYHEARILAARGQREGAVASLSAVLASDAEFAGRKKAEALLKSLQ